MKSSINLKEKQVEDLINQIKNARTLMIVSIKDLPSKQFNEIKKSIRDDGLVKITKKNIINRVLEKYGKESISGLKDFLKADFAFIISSKDGFELAGILASKKTPVFAKAGQIAPVEIEVKGGPTDLVPGPAISELGALGIQISVEDGKISIKKNKIVAKEGQEITEGIASLLQKLNIQPFDVGLDPLVIYDVKHEKIYTNIKIDSGEAKKDLTNVSRKALGFAQKIAYYCKETISYLLAKANSEGIALEKLVPEEPVVETKVEVKKEKVEEKKEKEPKANEEKEEKIESAPIGDDNNTRGSENKSASEDKPAKEKKPVEEAKLKSDSGESEKSTENAEDTKIEVNKDKESTGEEVEKNE